MIFGTSATIGRMAMASKDKGGKAAKKVPQKSMKEKRQAKKAKKEK